MLVVKNERNLKNIHCQFCYSSTMEEVMSFHVMANPELHSICGEWVMHIRDTLSEALKTEIDECGKNYGEWLYTLDLMGAIVDEGADYENDLPLIEEKIRKLPAAEFAYYLLGLCSTKEKISLDEFSGWYPDSGECVEQLKKRRYVEMEPEQILYIVGNVDAVKERLLAILRDYWEEAFHKEWDAISDYVRDIIYHEEVALSHMSLLEYLSQFHPKMKLENDVLIFDREPRLSILTGDIDSLIITPSIFGDDHLHGNVMEHRVNITLNLNYRALQVSRPVPDTYFQLLRGLSDESRFKILKVLWNSDATTKEISEILRLSPSTISIHLKILKDADLVTSRKVKKFVYYRLKKDRLMALQEETLNYLKY